MRIVQINTYDIRGGAARAVYRLHRGLLQIGEDCRMLVKHKASTDDAVLGVTPKNLAEVFAEDLFLSQVIQGYYINSHRTDISNTLFSLPYPGYDLSTLPLVQKADIVNLHWLGYYQSPLTLHKLFALGKPVVWTLHDQWAFTGGCHYAARCEKYCQDCTACPQMSDDPFNLPAAVLKDKIEFFKGANLTIVTPSRWLADCARNSSLFKGLRVEVIPNSLETDIFRPLPKAKAKEGIGIAEDSVSLLFGAEHGNEKRKGFVELMAAIQYCLEDAEFQNLVRSDKVRLLCFGRPSNELDSTGIPVVSLGYLNSDEEIRTSYAAADVFILPSLEDNLPNTILEAMSCGTPVVAFDVGGIPDVVVNGVTGQLASIDDVREMGEAILSLIFNPDQRELMGQNCRKIMLDGYSLPEQARRYADLYQELHQGYRSTSKIATGDSTAKLDQTEASVNTQTTEPLPIYLETTLGPHFQDIYDQVLFKALKEFATAREKAYQASEADRAARLEVIDKLEARLQESEADRKAQLKVIQELKQNLDESEKDRAARLKLIHELEAKLKESEADRTAQLKVIQELKQNFDESEKDRAARLKLIHELEARLQESEADRKAQLKVIQELKQRFDESEEDRAARLEVIQELKQNLDESEKDRAARLKVIHKLEARLHESEKDRAARLDLINVLTKKLAALQSNLRENNVTKQVDLRKSKKR